MLEPDRRHLLIDALRPPAGMTLDHAVGTTFSLDLEALLLAPVAFALFDARVAESGDPTRTDPLAVMEAVRRHADRIDLFCQSGQINLPPHQKPILALLEESVHPAGAASTHHIFHPKVWCLRFHEPQTKEVAFRLLVLSRNLTFDRSWDTLVRLDGAPATEPHEDNRALADFVSGLSAMSVRPVPTERRERIQQLAAELMSLEWELPDGFDGLRFLPSGIAGYSHDAVDRADRRLAISPFLTNHQVGQVTNASKRMTLVSRPESLDLIRSELLDACDEVLVLSDTSTEFESEEPSDEPADESDETHEAALGTTEATGERAGALGPGIHAKVFVTERGAQAEFRTGSTNATDAGWRGNVEFDVALTGHRRRCGVDVVLGTGQSETTLRTLLDTYQRSEGEPLEESQAESVLIELERYGRELARVPLTAEVESDGERYRIVVRSSTPLPASNSVELRSWLVTRKSETAQAQIPGQPVAFTEGALSLQALTSFIAMEASAPGPDGPVAVRLVLNATLIGAPEDRAERLLLEQLRTKADVLRYLLFLLADLGEDSAANLADSLADVLTDSESQHRSPQVPLLESMVRALARNPGALTPIDRLIADLSRTDEGKALLPDGLELVWPAIWEARSRVS